MNHGEYCFAIQLRKLYAKGDVTQAMLAERFGLLLSNEEHSGPSILEPD
jgi:hypothetical protein